MPLPGLILESVYERDVDLLLVEEFLTSGPFLSWWLETVKQELWDSCRLVGAWHSVAHTKLGETDILVLFEDSAMRTSALLIENKIDAPAQPEQGPRYRQRGMAGIEDGSWQRFCTCLVAPDPYLAASSDAASYDKRVSYENLREWLLKQGSPRHLYRASVIAQAIEENRRGYVPPTDEQVTKFFRAYWECASREFPELSIGEPRARPAGSNWVGFQPSGLAKGRRIWHKMDIGRVDLQIEGAAASVGRLRAKYASHLASDTTIEEAGKSAAIRIPVPRLDMLAPFEEQIDDARTGMRAAYRLYYQSRAITDTIAEESAATAS